MKMMRPVKVQIANNNLIQNLSAYVDYSIQQLSKKNVSKQSLLNYVLQNNLRYP